MAKRKSDQIRGRMGNVMRMDPDADTSDLRLELRAALLEAAIEKELAKAPPLSAEQKASLAALFRTPAGEDTSAA